VFDRGSGVRIEARAHGVEITFHVTNRRRDPIIRIQMGTSAAFVLTPEEMPKISNTPAGWIGMVVRDEASDVRVVWEAADASSDLASGSRTDFGLRVRTVYVQRPGQKDAGGNLLPYFNYRSLPFTARTASGACWSGRTSDPYAPPEGGYHASMRAAAVRAITSHPSRPILVDAPIGESLLRAGRRQNIFLTVPLALTFGVAGGFSAQRLSASRGTEARTAGCTGARNPLSTHARWLGSNRGRRDGWHPQGVKHPALIPARLVVNDEETGDVREHVDERARSEDRASAPASRAPLPVSEVRRWRSSRRSGSRHCH